MSNSEQRNEGGSKDGDQRGNLRNFARYPHLDN